MQDKHQWGSLALRTHQEMLFLGSGVQLFMESKAFTIDRAVHNTSLSPKGTWDTFMKFLNSTKSSLSWQKSHVNSTGRP